MLKPELQPHLQKDKNSNIRHNKKIIPLLLCFALAGASIFLLSPEQSQDSNSNIIQNAVIDQSGDKVPPDMKASIDGGFMTYTAKLQPIAIDEKIKLDIQNAPYLDEPAKLAMLEIDDNSRARITSVMLWDNFDQDGDVVRVQSGGITLEVPIFHAPTTIYIPYVPGEPIIIQGVYDGGGGITAAIETMSGPIPLPIMTVGQIIAIPLL